jgi:hypothetical protein
MSTQTQTQIKNPSRPKPTFTAVPTGLLQRKCACGGSPGVDGECEECREKRLSLQRRAANQAEPATVPPIVHEVLHTPGQPLDAATRAFMEPRFGYDFSQVRVHTDAKAAESARAVNALAYTVGRDVVFGIGQYEPGTMEGKRLLAHELTHTIQQSSHGSTKVDQNIQVGRSNDEYERTAEHLAQQRLRMEEMKSSGNNEALSLSSSMAPTTAVAKTGFLLQRVCRDHRDEPFYRDAPNYCKDTGFSGSLHPGQRCYREVPRRSSYFECPPGDQVCFDQNGGCHDSYDRVSTVERKNDDGTCNLHGLCFLGHAVADIIPGLLEESGRRQLECIQSCQDLPWYAQGFCMQSCTGGGPM